MKYTYLLIFAWTVFCSTVHGKESRCETRIEVVNAFNGYFKQLEMSYSSLKGDHKNRFNEFIFSCIKDFHESIMEDGWELSLLEENFNNSPCFAVKNALAWYLTGNEQFLVAANTLDYPTAYYLRVNECNSMLKERGARLRLEWIGLQLDSGSAFWKDAGQSLLILNDYLKTLSEFEVVTQRDMGVFERLKSRLSEIHDNKESYEQFLEAQFAEAGVSGNDIVQMVIKALESSIHDVELLTRKY